MGDDEAEWMQLSMRAGRVFTPTAPIDRQALFAGRLEQLRRVANAIGQKGQHVAIYGERGVGKTSLSNILNEALNMEGGRMLVGRVGCEATDSYSTIWRKFFDTIEVETEDDKPGFHPKKILGRRTLADDLPEELTSFDVAKLLSSLAKDAIVVPIIDEFDQIASTEVRAAFSSTIKTLSDASADVTIVLVGVADNISELVAAHISAERAIEQIFIPRMQEAELLQIIDRGMQELGMEIEEGARTRITRLSRGLPHYTHSLALHASRESLLARTKTVSMTHVERALKLALQSVSASTIASYETAVASSHKDALFRQVLLACALAQTDQQGYFYPVDVRTPMTRIMGERYEIPNFIQHLGAFCEKDRAAVLQKTTGERPRYRFRNPMLQPYVILTALSSGILKPEDLPA